VFGPDGQEAGGRAVTSRRTGRRGWRPTSWLLSPRRHRLSSLWKSEDMAGGRAGDSVHATRLAFRCVWPSLYSRRGRLKLSGVASCMLYVNSTWLAIVPAARRLALSVFATFYCSSRRI